MVLRADSVRVRRGGAGEPVLLLLHGLGATGRVWDGLHEELRGRWPGSWVIPDLPGHGGSAALDQYSYGHLTAALATGMATDGPVLVLGHSLGGVLALTLASGWFGQRVVAACGLGIKLSWSPEELAKASAMAARPVRTYPTRDEAAERHLAVAGLRGLLSTADPRLNDGLTRTADGWRQALDLAAFGVGEPDLPGLLAACRARVVLAAGEHDPMSPAEPLRALDSTAVILPGLGHNAHVEDPAALWPLLRRMLDAG